MDTVRTRSVGHRARGQQRGCRELDWTADRERRNEPECLGYLKGQNHMSPAGSWAESGAETGEEKGRLIKSIQEVLGSSSSCK